jgi:ABC-type antimicrobial peptide transport system permease subunit
MVSYLFLEGAPEQVMSFYGISIVVKSATGAQAIMRPVREQILALDQNLPVFNAATMQEHVDKALLLPRLCALLLGVFGGTGLVLAMVGLYGVMSFSVRSRTREIGIRMALGAADRGVLAMVARQGMTLVAVGLAVGLAISAAVTRFLTSMLYGVSATDALTFIAVPAGLVAIALVAVMAPARRAARVDPTVALRYQ